MTRILFYGVDLSARLRLSKAASELGAELITHAVGAPEAEPDVVVIDLDWAGESLRDLVRIHPDATALGYYSHIEEGKRLAAKDAGARAYARSRFWRETAALIAEAIESR